MPQRASASRGGQPDSTALATLTGTRCGNCAALARIVGSLGCSLGRNTPALTDKKTNDCVCGRTPAKSYHSSIRLHSGTLPTTGQQRAVACASRTMHPLRGDRRGDAVEKRPVRFPQRNTTIGRGNENVGLMEADLRSCTITGHSLYSAPANTNIADWLLYERC